MCGRHYRVKGRRQGCFTQQKTEATENKMKPKAVAELYTRIALPPKPENLLTKDIIPETVRSNLETKLKNQASQTKKKNNLSAGKKVGA